MLMQIDVKTLKANFRGAMLIEVEGDRRDLASDMAELVEVYDCIHTKKTYTILHVPHGSFPAPALGGVPVSQLR